MTVLSDTTLATEQKRHLVKALGRGDTVVFTIAVVLGLDVIGQAASYGFEAFTWTVVLTVLFLAPYGLITSELGSAFTAEGGAYEWVKLSMGRFAAGVNTVLYWVTNPLWIGGSLAFVGLAAWSSSISPIGTGTAGDYAFKVVFIWLTVLTGIVSVRLGKWVCTIGSLLKVVLVAFFSITVIIYAIEYGVHGIAAGDFTPTTGGLLAIVPLIIFSLVGFEAPNGAAEEMYDPQRDVPVAILRTGVAASLCYMLPILLTLLVLPASTISNLSGFLDAIHASYRVYGGAGGTLYAVSGIVFIVAIMNSGSTWLMCGDRMLAIAAADGSFFPWVGTFNDRLGTPLRANVFSGVIATAFMVAGTLLLDSGAADAFSVVLTIAISTTLLSYLLIIPSAYVLRRRYPDVARPFRFFGRGDRPLLVAVVLTTFWVALGSWTSVFPGTLDPLLGHAYSFHDTWGVGRGTFEALTLGTLAVIGAIAVAGYWSATGVRDADTGPMRLREAA